MKIVLISSNCEGISDMQINSCLINSSISVIHDIWTSPYAYNDV